MSLFGGEIRGDLMQLHGWIRLFFIYDVAEEIRLDTLASLIPADSGKPESRLVRPSLQFERMPVTEILPGFSNTLAANVCAKARYYDYGVLSIELSLQFESNWQDLLQNAVRWNGAPEMEQKAAEMAHTVLNRAAPALVRPAAHWLREDYVVIHIREIAKEHQSGALTSGQLLNLFAQPIAQIVRAELVPLSDAERQEVLQSSISYSDQDLLVVGWTSALVYGTSEIADITLQLLEYANTQLLEFRYYDRLLTTVLNNVYRSLNQKSNSFTTWRWNRRAVNVSTIRLDIMELTERIDNVIKFVGDMFYARLYAAISAKIGVNDYRMLVDQKLRTAGELYRLMVDQFNQSRSFLLEVAVVVILLIELVFVFRGK